MAREEFLLVDDREVVITDQMHARCDGGPMGHPTEFLTLEKGGVTRCKYCDRRYIHVQAALADELRRRAAPYAL